MPTLRSKRKTTISRPKRTFYRSASSAAPTRKKRTTTVKRPVKRMVVRKPEKASSETLTTGVGLRYGPVATPKVDMGPERAPVIAVKQPDIPTIIAPEISVAPMETKIEVELESLNSLRSDKQDQLAEINQMILAATKRLQELTEQGQTQADVIDDQAEVVEEIEEFNGTDTPDEKLRLLQEELEARRRAEQKLKKELEALKQVYEDEQEELKTTIRKLKQDLHRTAPITEHKFFSLSRELGEAVKAINLLTTDIPVDVPLGTDGPITPVVVPETTTISPAITTSPTPTPTPTVTPKQVVAQPVVNEPKPETPTPSPQPDATTNQVEPANESDKVSSKPTKKAKKKKLLITGGAAVIILIALSAGLSMQLNSEPDVDEELVSQYLQTNAEKEGEVQGATTDQTTPNLANSGSVPGAVASDADKYKESQSDVSFADSIWEKLKDPMFGLELEYPANSVNVIKTDSSITFIRKTGYIFKVSRVETGLELADYWKQIQAASLNYLSEEATLNNQPAMHLVLQDSIDYPGNRYLVKSGDFIFDIWYATGGPKFSSDDVARAKRILDTVTLVK